MKRLYSGLLLICLIWGIVIPARATEEVDTPLVETEMAPIEVETLEELQGAIEEAEDGDTIYLLRTIYVWGKTLSTDKDVTIACADSFSAKSMFDVYDSTICGLSIDGTGANMMCEIRWFGEEEQETFVGNCIFNGNGNSAAILVYGTGYSRVEIDNCEFKSCVGSAVDARISSSIIMKNCYVHDSYNEIAVGAVQCDGDLTLDNCTITHNSAFASAGVHCSGSLIISGGAIRDNVVRSTEWGAAVDVYCNGTWSITDEEHDGAGYYDVVSGEKITLPVSESTALAKLVYLDDDKVADFFKLVTGEDDDLNDTNEETPPEVSQEPQEPSEDDSDIDQPKIPETQSNSDKEPQEPTQEKHSDDDEGNLPVEPSQTVDTSVEAVSPTVFLQCGNAVIDCSRSAVLYGYGDGLLHEDDPLTRAQMATIIFRLLNEESTAKLSTHFSSFVDVPADAWCAAYVLPLADAGVVNGTGGGYYSPNNLATWGQFLTVLGRFVEPQECILWNIQYDGWARQAVETAVALGWIEDSAAVNPNAVITRGEAVALINTVLEMN